MPSFLGPYSAAHLDGLGYDIRTGTAVDSANGQDCGGCGKVGLSAYNSLQP